MIVVEVNGKRYQVCNTWMDVTIETAAKVAREPLPDSLKEYYDLSVMEDSPARNQRWQDFEMDPAADNRPREWGDYYGRIITLLSDIPAEVMRYVDVNSRQAVYELYLRRFVMGLHYFPVDYQSRDIHSFELDGEVYYLPTSRYVMGTNVPMAGATALEFTETADLVASLQKFAEKDYARMSNIISILCRPKDEPYDEAVCLERSRKFMALPMSTAWDVFFSLTVYSAMSRLYGQTFLNGMQKLRTKKEQTKSQRSGGTGKSSLPRAKQQRSKRLKK